MRLHTLRPNAGARHRKKRLGCGESSGHGKTSGRGHKGQKARTGAAIRPGFEGGQMPLHRQSPKRGFNNSIFRRKVALVNVSGLEKRFEEDAVVNEASLREAGLIRGACDAVKILGTGSLTRRLTLEGVLCSASARQKVEEAGGVVRAPEAR